MLRTIIYYMFTRIFQFFEVWCMCVYFNYPGKVYSIIPDVFSNNAYLHNQVVTCILHVSGKHTSAHYKYTGTRTGLCKCNVSW